MAVFRAATKRFLLGVAEPASPTVLLRMDSTSPVQEPQELEALVWARTSSRVNSPCLAIARFHPCIPRYSRRSPHCPVMP